MSRISAILRWLKAKTVTPRSMSSRTISAWRSEKARTRSGSTARILSNLAVVKAEILGFLRASGGRAV